MKQLFPAEQLAQMLRLIPSVTVSVTSPPDTNPVYITDPQSASNLFCAHTDWSRWEVLPIVTALFLDHEDKVLGLRKMEFLPDDPSRMNARMMMTIAGELNAAKIYTAVNAPRVCEWAKDLPTSEDLARPYYALSHIGCRYDFHLEIKSKTSYHLVPVRQHFLS